MGVAKRAMVSIIRRFGKSAILFMVVFILGNVIAGSIAINQATEQVEWTIKEQLGAATTIEADYQLISEAEGHPELSPLPVETLDAVGKLEMVKFYDYQTSVVLNADDMNIQQVEETDERNRKMMASDKKTITLQGGHNPEITDVKEGQSTIKEGRAFSQEEIDEGKSVGLISAQLAEMNGYNVGDEITLSNIAEDFFGPKMGLVEYEPAWDGGFDVVPVLDERQVAITIIGIFEPKLVEPSIVPAPSEGDAKSAYFVSPNEHEYMNAALINKIYVPNKVVNNEEKFRNDALAQEYAGNELFEQNNYTGEFYRNVFILKSAEDVEAFRKKALPLLPEYYKVSANADAYEAIAGSIVSMKDLSQKIVFIGIGATITILSLLIILFLRDRKAEFGIYISLGETKAKIILQMVIEVLVVSIFAMTLSLATGNILAQNVSQMMIENQLEATVENDSVSYGIPEERLYETTELGAEDIVDKFSITFDKTYFFIFYGIGSATILLATIIPAMYTLRINPRKILM